MWGSVISGVASLVKLLIGTNQKNKAKSEAENNVAPKYPISQLYADKLGVAQNEAMNGFSPETLNAFNQTSQQNLSAGAENILQGGGNVNDIAKLYAVDNTARRTLGVENDKLRAVKLQNYFEQASELAGQQAIKWRLDYFDRWKDKAAATAMMAQNANGLISGGINGLGSSLGSLSNLSNVNQLPTSPKPPIDNSWNHNIDKINTDWMNTTPAYSAQTSNWFGQQVTDPLVVNNPTQPIF